MLGGDNCASPCASHVPTKWRRRMLSLSIQSWLELHVLLSGTSFSCIESKPHIPSCRPGKPDLGQISAIVCRCARRPNPDANAVARPFQVKRRVRSRIHSIETQSTKCTMKARLLCLLGKVAEPVMKSPLPETATASRSVIPVISMPALVSMVLRSCMPATLVQRKAW
jgi:hypothetical protein